ncbi:MAG: hypothetical protein AAGA30_19880, partial [Planctomycetota bacterium]
KAEYQIVTAEIRFLTENEGGRRTSIDLSGDSLYRPHFVVQNRMNRKVKMDGNKCTELYNAMTFISGPENYVNGNSDTFCFYCPNWDQTDHPDLNTGTEFTIREGGKIVAGGTVIEKIEPNQGPNRQIKND